ncbi:transposase-like protein%2C IS1381 ISSpn7 [Streptococcus pneumoniae]|nr:transposase-like protein%2C IS1381 ISSpn7 [Streptococcus pneumoniae]
MPFAPPLPIAKEIQEVHSLGIEIALVIGGGNLWRGEPAAEAGMDRVQADYTGMLGTVMNALVMADSLQQVGVQKILADSGYQGLMKIYPQAQTPRKSSKLKPLTAEDKACNHALSKERSKVENIFAKVKTFKMFSTTYRNHRKRFGLRMNLIAGIINHELGF